MIRDALRVVFVLSLIMLAVSVPVISSGYAELERASTSNSYVEMAEHYGGAAWRMPWRADLYELAGHAYYHAKEYSLAAAAYREAFQHNRLSPEGWVAWGDVNYLNDEPQRAAEIWTQALEQENPSDQLYSRLSQIYEENADYERAAQVLQKYVSAHLDDASARYRLGLLWILSDADKATEELISASHLDPQLDPAVQTLRTALNLVSLTDSPDGRLVILGRGLGLVEEWPLARAAFQKAVEMDAKNAEAWAWLGEANQHTDREGSVELDQALRLDPNSAIVRGLRGLHFQRTSNFRQALTEFQWAVKLDKDNPAWFVSLGESYSKLGDLIHALDAYQSATALAPEDEKYWRLLAIFCAQNGVNVKDVGIPAAERAVVLAKDDVASLDVLGWLLLLDERNPEAERMLTRALELDPQYAPAHLHLGMVYLQKDDRASAYDHLIRAHDLGSAEAQVLLNQYFP